ncbi:MAG: class I SAM-dependent methyltransferase [Candidatus Rokuibacteriota bacterium]
MTPDPVSGDGLLPSTAYGRDDERADTEFYASPRKVVHIDDGAIEALRQIYTDVLPADGCLLDLMSSWRSHLRTGLPTRQVVGLGLNAEEMADNPQLTRHVIHDLNRVPRLPFGDQEFDAAMCAVSIQYVLHPVLVFREVCRVLRPGAPFVVSFSNRCFPTKAVAVWLDSTDRQHLMLVRKYFESVGGWSDLTEADCSPDDGDPLYVMWARKGLGRTAAPP